MAGSRRAVQARMMAGEVCPSTECSVPLWASTSTSTTDKTAGFSLGSLRMFSLSEEIPKTPARHWAKWCPENSTPPWICSSFSVFRVTRWVGQRWKARIQKGLFIIAQSLLTDKSRWENSAVLKQPFFHANTLTLYKCFDYKLLHAVSSAADDL